MWQWNEFISPLIRFFNVYVPDLIFFGNSYTTRPERSESFQARCMMRLMDSLDVQKVNVVGISYGGFVSYSMAVQFPERLDKLVLCCAGVCLEEKDMADGMFVVKNVDEAASILLPQTPAKLKELIRLTFVKPARILPTCIIDDFIDVSDCCGSESFSCLLVWISACLSNWGNRRYQSDFKLFFCLG